MLCPNCGTENTSDSLFCIECGTPIFRKQEDADAIVCPHCGTKNTSDALFCIECGNTVRQEQEDTALTAVLVGDPEKESAETSPEGSEEQTEPTETTPDSPSPEPKRGLRRNIATAVGYVLAFLFLCLWLIKYQEYDALQSEFRVQEYGYQELNNQYEELQDKLSGRDSDYSKLKSKYEKLDADYDDLEKARDRLQTSYDNLKKERDSLQKSYNDLKEKHDSYNLEGRYRININDYYNESSTSNLKISDNVSASSLQDLRVKFTVYDDTKKWSGKIYVDIIRPDGRILDFSSDANGHSKVLSLNASNASGNSNAASFYFGDSAWTKGTYRLVFYQGDTVIYSYSIKVS